MELLSLQEEAEFEVVEAAEEELWMVVCVAEVPSCRDLMNQTNTLSVFAYNLDPLREGHQAKGPF